MSVKALFLGAFLVAATALATPPNQAVLDGRPSEYDATDLRGTYTGGGGTFGAANYITNLYVTWDTNFLYLALQGAEDGNKLVILLDVDPGNGTGASTTTNWVRQPPGYIGFNDVGWQKSDADGAVDFGLDYQVASEGFFNNILRIVYDGIETPDTNNVDVLFDHGNGTTPVGSPVDMVAYGDATACDLKGIEARIPWSVLYPTNNRFGAVLPGDLVPMGATLRLFANLHNNDSNSAFSASDAIPQQVSTNASYAGGLLVTDTYIDLIVDADNNGIPDVATGDVNAPFIRYASGVQAHSLVFVQLSEALNADTATEPNNWRVGTDTPGSVTMTSTNTLSLNLTNALPAAGTLVVISATNIQDDAANERPIGYCMAPVASGLTNALTVRFVLESSSGMGLSHAVTNFFLNGGSFPLEFGFPPSTLSPLAVLSGSLRYRDVVFPPGTPQVLNYKYSGTIPATGTNTYEAVRLNDFGNAARRLTLPLDASSLTITDYLGAAAGPLRDPNNPTNYAALYSDPRRGDAGVRQRTTITFKLDLSQRNRSIVSRVLVEGSDPLRGFNVNGTLPVGVSDYPAGGAVGWQHGGITMFDDGTHGDTNANDGIYMRTWSFSTNGVDALTVNDNPFSLVGGAFTNQPYAGSGWANRRSPRSIAYKFAVLLNNGAAVESAGGNLEYYIEDAVTTNILLDPFVWDNDALPLPPPSNSPTMTTPVLLAGATNRVLFSNVSNELQHGVLVATNLAQGWMNFGHRASGSGGNWTGVVANANPGAEFYAAFAGPPQPFRGVRLEPSALADTGGTLRIYYTQHSRGLAGDRNVQIAGTFTAWSPVPMTFVGNGVWQYDLSVTEATATNIEFKPRNLSGSQWEGFGGSTGGEPNYRAYKGFGRASWSPLSPTNGELLTIDYDGAGTPFATSPNLNVHLGYDEPWGGTDYPMTNTGGSAWTITLPVSTTAYLSANFVFNNRTNGVGGIWDSENDHTGRLNRAFITPQP